MDIGILLLTLSVLLLAVLFIVWALFEARQSASAPQGQDLSALMAERDQVINALQQLDFDNSLGKVPEEDYIQQRTELVKRGAEVLRKMDELSTQPDSADDAEKRLEAV